MNCSHTLSRPASLPDNHALTMPAWWSTEVGRRQQQQSAHDSARREFPKCCCCTKGRWVVGEMWAGGDAHRTAVGARLPFRPAVARPFYERGKKDVWFIGRPSCGSARCHLFFPLSLSLTTGKKRKRDASLFAPKREKKKKVGRTTPLPAIITTALTLLMMDRWGSFLLLFLPWRSRLYKREEEEEDGNLQVIMRPFVLIPHRYNADRCPLRWSQNVVAKCHVIFQTFVPFFSWLPKSLLMPVQEQQAIRSRTRWTHPHASNSMAHHPASIVRLGPVTCADGRRNRKRQTASVEFSLGKTTRKRLGENK